MSRYDEYFEAGRTDLDRDEATRRAYVLGIAASLGNPDREERAAILDAVETAYEESMVELAYEEGRTEGREARERSGIDDEADVWEALIEDIELPDGDDDADNTTDLPPAVERSELLDRPEPGVPEQTDRPDFLEK